MQLAQNAKDQILEEKKVPPQTLYDFKVRTINGKEISMEDFRGKTLLIVNVASKCGFTPQYAGLQTLYQQYKSYNFEILGFPCNQFAKQEPGDSEQIKRFCSTNYGVTFPLFEKIKVNGRDAHPLYTFLKNHASATLGSTMIKWNFTKFLVNAEGIVVKRFGPADTPSKIAPEIESLLKISKH